MVQTGIWENNSRFDGRNMDTEYEGKALVLMNKIVNTIKGRLIS